jgi:hypothetical protein
MESRMPNARRSHKVDTVEEVTIIDEEIPEFVSIRLLKSLVLKTKGEATGTIYIFNGAGSIVNVDKSDVESIMKRNKSVKSCCGSYSSPYFEIV